MTPYFHPTTVVLVDDHVRFMENFRFGLHAVQVNFKLFSSVQEALTWINEINPPSFFPEEIDMEENTLPSFKERMFDPARFDELAVVIVDYDMPEMNGITFCQAIHNKQIRKIMLTGVADEKIALHAFNNDTIDRFIIKQDAEALEKVAESINILQQNYFGNQAVYLQQNKTIHDYLSFMDEAAFKTIFDEVFSQGGYIEYYVDTTPDGVWLVKANGDTDFLAVQDEDLFADQLLVARDQSAPAGLLKALSRDDIVTCFQHGGYYTPACSDWQSSLHQASIFEGNQQNYRYALVKGLSPDDGTTKLLSFNTFLDR